MFAYFLPFHLRSFSSTCLFVWKLPFFFHLVYFLLFPWFSYYFFFYSPDVWRVRGIAGRMSMRQSFSTTAGIMG